MKYFNRRWVYGLRSVTNNVINSFGPTILRKRYIHSLIKRNFSTCNSASIIDTGTINYEPGMKVNSLFSFWNSKFMERGISEPNESINYIIAHALGRKTLWNLDRESTLIREEQYDHINEMCRKRLDKMPVQYVIGEWDFCELVLKMEPPVLIPRPETEHLVNFVCKDLVSSGNRAPTILDIGCGSGAIALAILHKLAKSRAVAIDQSLSACDLTKVNAELNRLDNRLKVHLLELTDHLLESEHEILQEKFDVVVSNPPYICSGDVDSLQEEITGYEDPKALDGGKDGLDIVRVILNSAAHVLKEKGSLWLEVSAGHPEIIESLVSERKNLKMKYVETLQDFNKIPRFCHLVYDPS